MGFSDWIKSWFYDVDVVDVREGFWANPVFDDEEVYNLYNLYLRRAGHCPKCNDFCFIDIEQDNIGYKVIKRCISTDCDYKEDISHEFNKDLGIKTIVDNDARLDFVNRFNDIVQDNFQQEEKNHQRIGVPDVSYHYYNLNQHIQDNIIQHIQEDVPKCTGTLKNSFLYIGFNDDGTLSRRIYSKNFRIVACDELPVASKDNSRAIYLVHSPNIDDVLEEYIVVEDFDGNYSWAKIGENHKEYIFNFLRLYDKTICLHNVYKNDFLNEISRNAKGYK